MPKVSVDFILMEMEIRIKKLKDFEKVAKNESALLTARRYRARRLELENLKTFIRTHEDVYGKL